MTGAWISRWLLLGAGVLAGLTAALHPVRAADPAYYLKKTTWVDSMLASVAALEAENLEAGFASFESRVLKGGQAAQRVSVEIAGAQELSLWVTGEPDNVWGVANWAEARLLDTQGQAHYLTTKNSPRTDGPGEPALEWTVRKGRHDLNINLHSGLYEPIAIGGCEFGRGLHVQADSEILVPLAGQYQRFEAWIGVDDWAGTNGHVRFAVLGRKAARICGLWDLLARDFPHEAPRREMRWERQDRIWSAGWKPGDYRTLAQRYAAACAIPDLARQARRLADTAREAPDLRRVREFYVAGRRLQAAADGAAAFDFRALALAVEDLRETFGSQYPGAPDCLRRLRKLEASVRTAAAQVRLPNASLAAWEELERLAGQCRALQRDALLANPLLDFERLLVIKRRPLGDPRRSQWADRGLGEYVGMPRQSSWGHGTMAKIEGWDNQIAVLSPVRPEGRLESVFEPTGGRLVTDVDLHWTAERMLVSLPDAQRRWQVCELRADGKELRPLTPGDQPDVHCYDACYLPNGKIAFISTAPLQGVPCNAGVIVGMMYVMDGDGQNIRQVCFEQDHDYTPSVLNNGRVLYLRWDYTDTPHVWNRLLMSMNPDGTGQSEYYGSNSYWPNAMFFARAIPGHPTKIVAIVTGHHEGRVGDLVIFDPARGRHEVEGVIQRIPGRGQKVQPLIEDKLTEHNWPKFLHPWPLSDKYFLVSCKPSPDSLWGVYLADVFDNLVLVRELEEYALLEPIPFRPTRQPPVIPEKVQPQFTNAVVFLQDVYAGPGLKDVPRGAIKSLRLFTYHFGYQRLAGIDHRVGTDGPWEIKRVLGTVPVEADGSALFRIPAKLPISLQPLDAEGQAVALMRSWMTAMPGEIISCVGCHDRQGTAPPNRQTLALQGEPADIQPWHGPVRGFSFSREVQPVLDKYCVACHNGRPRPEGAALTDLRGDQGAFVVYEHGNPVLKRVRASAKGELLGQYAGVFEPAYIALREFVRVGGLESDLHVLPPKEFHANTSELVQMLTKGHHGVRLDPEAWDRLVTWIDLNAPCHGSWGEVAKIPISNQPERRRFLRTLYGGIDEDAERTPLADAGPVEPVMPEPVKTAKTEPPACPGWPFSAVEAAQRQQALGPVSRRLDLGGGVTLELVRIPAGRFVMGDAAGDADEQPLCAVEVERPFWLGKFEVTNEQYSQFDPSHDSRFEHRSSWIFHAAYLGWPLNRPRQPVVRVSWNEAMAFCKWLSHKTGQRVTLPTEAQWEYACRAGASTPLGYGDLDTDFAKHANMADETLRNLAYDGWRPRPPDLVPRDRRFNDGALVTTEVGHYLPNAWGVHDLHGNAAEWTRDEYRPYPPSPQASDRPHGDDTLRVVRGGSWRDRPKRCRSAFRLGYPAYQKVFNVGFRVVLGDQPEEKWAGAPALTQPSR